MDFRWPAHFSGPKDVARLHCHHTKALEPPNPELFQWGLDALERLREEVNAPLIITSGWRSLGHPIEATKSNRAIHAHYHCGFDIRCSGTLAVSVLAAALNDDWFGIGVSQKGPWRSRYIHLDRAPGRKNKRTIWSY